MSTTASLNALESHLAELAGRLVRQEETTRRLEATLKAFVRLPEARSERERTGDELVLTPGPSSPTPPEVRWPTNRPAQKVRTAADTVLELDSSDYDLLKAVAGFVPDPLVGLDVSGRVRVWNPAAEAAFGWTAAEVVGFPPPFLPDDRRAEQAQLLAMAGCGRDVRSVASVRKKKDGTLVRVRLSATGYTGGAAFVLKPEPPAHLRPALFAEESISDGPSADALAGIKRIITAVVHDLNNLFTVVCGGSEVLIERHATGDPRRADAEMIHAAGVHAARLVWQLTTLAADVPQKPARADLNTVLRDMTPVLRGVLGQSRELRVDAGATAATVAADPARMSQVLLNLAANARDAMPAGGTVYISTGLDDSARVVLTVRDTGPGIDPAVRARMFERNVSTKDHSRGIGLATVAEVVAQAGGQIAVESAPGQGTAILLILPQVEASGVELAAAG